MSDLLEKAPSRNLQRGLKRGRKDTSRISLLGEQARGENQELEEDLHGEFVRQTGDVAALRTNSIKHNKDRTSERPL